MADELSRARTDLAAGRHRAAERRLLGLLSLPDQRGEAAELLSVLFLETDQALVAAHHARQGLEWDADRPGLYRCLARSHWELGRLDEAIETLLTGIARLPAEGGLYLDAALYLRGAGLEEQAVALLEAALDRGADSRWEVEHLRLEILVAIGDHHQAIAAALDILADSPDDVSAYDRLAAAHYGAGDLEGAIAAAEQVATRTPLMLENQLRLAGLLREHGDVPRAVTIWEHVAGHAEQGEHRETAAGALRASDDAQIPMLLMLAGESPLTRRELRADPAGGSLRRGFFLSQSGVARLAAALGDEPGGVPLQ